MIDNNYVNTKAIEGYNHMVSNAYSFTFFMYYGPVQFFSANWGCETLMEDAMNLFYYFKSVFKSV